MRTRERAQASHGGDTTVRLYWNQSQSRDIFYARYIDWCALPSALAVPSVLGYKPDLLQQLFLALHACKNPTTYNCICPLLLISGQVKGLTIFKGLSVMSWKWTGL